MNATPLNPANERLRLLMEKLGDAVVRHRLCIWAERRPRCYHPFFYCRLGKVRFYIGRLDDKAAFLELVRQKRLAELGAEQSLNEVIAAALKGPPLNSIHPTMSAILSDMGKRKKGQRIHIMRSSDPETVWRREFRSFSKSLLEKYHPELTEDGWVNSRKNQLAEIRRRARLGLASGKPLHPRIETWWDA